MDTSSTLTREAALKRVDHAFAVIVDGKSVRRHLYLNLPGAERAIERAAANGYTAHMTLVRLEVVEEVDADA